MEDKWLVACKEIRLTSPINSKLFCTISTSHPISSSSNTTTRLHLVESEEKYREEI